MAETPPAQSPMLQRSRGEGRLSVTVSGNRTRIAKLYQQGCAKLRIPSNRNTALEAVMINTSGGMTGGDLLDWQFDCSPSSDLTVTTQACERIYKSSGGTAHTRIRISVEEMARLAWLPQETILFDGGAFHRTIEADLVWGAEALFVEPLIFGRKTMGETVEQASFRDRWRIRVDGRLVHAEDFAISGDISNILARKAVTGEHTAFATLLLISPAAEGYVHAAREVAGADGGVSCWNGKLLARLVAEDGYGLRKKLAPLIGLLNRGASLPKTWAL